MLEIWILIVVLFLIAGLLFKIAINLSDFVKDMNGRL